MEAGGGVSAPVICESRLARSLTFKSWRKLISESTKLLAFKKCNQRTQEAVRLPFLGTGQKPLQSYHPSVLRAAAAMGGEASGQAALSQSHHVVQEGRGKWKCGDPLGLESKAPAARLGFGLPCSS